MSEFLFVVKCLFFTIILVIMMQVKINGTSVENYSYHWLQRSNIPQYLQNVASGGVLAIKNLGKTIQNGFAGASDSAKQSVEQAGR